MSSSISNESTFFKTLDDHVTQPVLFIPETHLSSLQRMVRPPSATLCCCWQIPSLYPCWVNHGPDPWIPVGGRTGTREAGKKLWESMWWEKWAGKRRGGLVSVKVRGKIKWANWSRNQALVQAAAATDTDITWWGLRWKHTPVEPYSMHHPHISCGFHLHTLAKTLRWGCCSDRPVFPRCAAESRRQEFGENFPPPNLLWLQNDIIIPQTSENIFDQPVR